MKKLFLVAAVAALALQPAPAADILSPGDPILAFDFDSSLASSYPAAETPVQSRDEDSNTKYLNFGKEGTGLIFTPWTGPSTVQSMSFTTANDWPARDPDSWEIYGTNDTIVSEDNSGGDAESWTLIASGAANLPGGSGDCVEMDCTTADARFTPGPIYPISNSASYDSYKVVFPTIKNSDIADSMQVAEVILYQSTDGTGTPIGGFFDDPVIAIGTVKLESSYPAAESPAQAIDGVVTTKYLNFGKENSGFIVTPSAGASVVNQFQMTTANDEEPRDPSSWELYGTNDAIMSVDNGDGMGESWTLIDSGDVFLPMERETPGDIVTVNNTEEYTSYRMVITGLKNAMAANSMQFAEIQFFGEIVGGVVDGDFNNDGAWGCLDIDALTAAIAAESTDLAFDMNGDGVINLADVTDEGTGWLAVGGANNVADTGGNPFLSGDANLSGEVDVSDFNEWNTNKFTDQDAWCSGDFNADGVIDVSDFNEWNGNKFQSSSDGVSAVPEPGAWCLALISFSVCLWRRRRDRK